jgi:hypothetical protein
MFVASKHRDQATAVSCCHPWIAEFLHGQGKLLAVEMTWLWGLAHRVILRAVVVGELVFLAHCLILSQDCEDPTRQSNE